MRKGITVVLAAALVAAVLSIAGCGPAKPKEKVLGMSFPAADHGWVAAVIYNAKKQAEDMGVKYILTTGANPAEQSSKVDELIAQKVSAIVMLPSDTKPLTPAAQRVLKAKIPLIIFDRKVEVEPTFYLGGDNAGIGVNGAKFIGEKLGGKGIVVSVGVPAYGSVHTDRVNAFKDTMTKEFPNIRIAKEVGAENSSKEAGLKIMSDLLNAEKHIDAVFTIDDELSIGILQAISENKRRDIKVETGAGGAQEYFKAIGAGGPITLASFLYSPLMIKDAVKAAVDIMNGKVPDQKAVIIPANAVTKDNVDQYLDANSPY